jgi:uncharacterized membrane protein YdjX (TVP38/TMEM64 family)
MASLKLVTLLRDRRTWFAVFILAVFLAAQASGLNEYLSIAALAENRSWLLALVRENMAVAVVVFLAAYVCLVALSLPGSQMMTITGGFLFGTLLGSALSVIGATAGAIVIFMAITRIFGPVPLSRLGRRVEAVAMTIRSEAWSYLFVLRLVPVAPFFAVNLAAAVVGVSLRTFALTTFFGIIPGSLAYSMFGAGFGTMFDAGRVPGFTELLTPEILYGIGSLAALAFLAIPVKRYLGMRRTPRL